MEFVSWNAAKVILTYVAIAQTIIIATLLVVIRGE